MQTKYIRLRDGTIAMWSESTGIAHFAMVNDYMQREIAQVTDAGFAYHDSHGFKVYGKSPSLGLGCDQYAAIELDEAMRDGRLTLRSIPRQEESYFVTTLKKSAGGISSVSELYSARILAD